MDATNCVQLVASAALCRLVRESWRDLVDILPGKLSFAVVPQTVASRLIPELASAEVRDHQLPIAAPVDDTNHLITTVDESLVYARFFADFGPLDLGQTVRFCRDLTQRLAASPTMVLVTSDHPHKRANTMTLLALFLVAVHGMTPTQAVAPFRSLRPAQGFRDAACGTASFFLTVLDCARALHKAMQCGVWSYESFSLDEYEYYDKLSHGDINWIVPGKVLAFSGPQRERVVLDANGSTTLLAADYAKVFQALGVSCVVRFNEPETYDRRAFIHANIRHLDLEYPDGGNPTDAIMLKFVRACERESGAVAVHCKAGLGRTGTNIAAYLIKKLAFSAVEAIAWCRLCRPGSIVGPQQQFLITKQPLLRQLAAKEDDLDDIEQKQTQHHNQSVDKSPVTQRQQQLDPPRQHRHTTTNSLSAKLLAARGKSGAIVVSRSRIGPTR